MANEQAKAQEPLELIRVESKGDTAQLYLEGVVGVQHAKRLQQLAITLVSLGKNVIVRCEHLQQIDGAGVQVLLALHETLKGRGIEMKVQNLPDSVQETLRTAGLASAF